MSAHNGHWAIERYGMQGELCKVYDSATKQISEGYTTELNKLVTAHNASCRDLEGLVAAALKQARYRLEILRLGRPRGGLIDQDIAAIDAALAAVGGRMLTVRQQHGQALETVTFHPDGRVVFSSIVSYGGDVQHRADGQVTLGDLERLALVTLLGVPTTAPQAPAATGEHDQFVAWARGESYPTFTPNGTYFGGLWHARRGWLAALARQAEALRPFAELAELFDDENRGVGMPREDSDTVMQWPRLHKVYELTVGHLRAARAVLRTTRTDKEADHDE